MKKLVLLFCCAIFSQLSAAATVSWVDWTSKDDPASTVYGVVNGVDATFSGSYYDFHNQITGDTTNHWDHPASNTAGTYTAPPIVDNPPPDSDMITMRDPGLRTLTFSQPVVNPVMALLSMGRSTIPVEYQFDTAVNILNVGPGYYDPGGNGSLVNLTANTIKGWEGHGLIQFSGTFTSISWNVDVFEDWHGIQVGVENTVVPIPAAVWLFGTGLVGLFALARRKSRV